MAQLESRGPLGQRSIEASPKLHQNTGNGARLEKGPSLLWKQAMGGRAAWFGVR